MTYTWKCPACGRECRDRRAYVARHAGECLPCIRTRNGWQHQPGCSADDPEHRGPCPLEEPQVTAAELGIG